ncbi:MAG: 16S rRNA (guanine(527)-N(7))-methyltransferase RsmG [Thermodesulfobacteriota bacterium]
MKESIEGILYKGANAINVSLTPREIELFKTYLMELKRWSSKINITAIHDDIEIVVKHFIDSLSPLNYIPQNSSLLDIGSGGGFPGIPLKIANPSLSVTLLDSTLKKVNFQKQIIRLLQLNNIKAVHGRAEDKSSYRKTDSPFDVVISRAFSGLGKFLAIGEPYLKRDGLLIAMRGRGAKRELAVNEEVLTCLRLKLVNIVEFNLPYLNEKRKLIVLTK